MKEIISDTWWLFRKNFLAILALSLPFIILAKIIDISSIILRVRNINTPFILSIIGPIVHLAYIPILILLFNQIINKNILPKKQTLLKGISFLPKTVAVTVLIFIPLIPILLSEMFILFSKTLTDHRIYIYPIQIGFILYILARTSFAYPLIILEKSSILMSLKNSFNFTKEYSTQLIILFLSFLLFVFLLKLILTNIFQLILFPNSITSLFIDIVTEVLFIFVQVGIFKIYCISYTKRAQTIMV